MAEYILLLDGLPCDLDSVRSKLDLYFKNKRKSGGEVLEIRDYPEDKRKALLVYLNDRDQKRVLEKINHKVDFKAMGVVELNVKLNEDDANADVNRIKLVPDPFVNVEKQILTGKSLPIYGEKQQEPLCQEGSQRGEDNRLDTLIVTSTSHVNQDLLKLYFEQFSDNVSIKNLGGNRWILNLAKQSEVDNLLNKKVHEVNSSLSVERYDERAAERNLDPRRFVLSGFSADSKCSFISIYIKSCSKGAEHGWEVLNDRKEIVVTFKQDIDIKDFMKKCSTKKIQDMEITASQLEYTDSVLIQGEMSSISEEEIKLYFSNKQSRGGKIGALDWIHRATSVIVTFEDFHVAHRVAEGKHSLGEVSLSTLLFYRTFQKALTGETPPLQTAPCKVPLHLEPAFLDNLRCNDEFKEEFEKTLGEVYASVTYDRTTEPHQVVLEMAVDSESLLMHYLAPTWEIKAMDAAKALLNKYNVILLGAKTEIWERIKDRCLSRSPGDAVVSYDSSTGNIMVVGKQSEVKCLEGDIRLFVKEADEILKVEMNTVDRKIPVNTKEEFRFFQTFMSGKLEEVECLEDEANLTFQLKGLKESVNLAEKAIKDIQMNLVTQTLNLSVNLTQFLKSCDLKKFERDHFEQNCISAMIFNNVDSFQILGDKKNVHKSFCKINDVLREEVIKLNPDQAKITTNENWRIFFEGLKDDLESSSNVDNVYISQSDEQIIISGLSSVVADIARKLKGYLENKIPATEEIQLKSMREVEFISSFMNLLDVPDLKSLGATILPSRTPGSPSLKVTAAREKIKEAVAVVMKQVSLIVMEKHVYSKAGEAKVLEKHQASFRAKAKDFVCCLYLTNDQANQTRAGSEQRMVVGGVSIILKKGDITKECVDAIVNSTNKSLNLNTGVSGAILKAAGKSVAEECQKLGTQKADGVVVTGGGDLTCKHILQMVGPKDTAGIIASVKKVLQLCESKKISTVSLPAIGTGKGNIEFRQSIEAVLEGIESHLLQMSSSCIKSITIVAFEESIFQAMCGYFAKRYQLSLQVRQTSYVPPSAKIHSGLLANEVKIGAVRIEVKKGSIITESVRGIVNTTNKNLNLTGGVSGAILQAAGSSVEEECKILGPQGDDGVVVTSGGSLHCNFIIHMVGPTTTAGVTSQTERVLEQCEKNQITTVSFPAVGTGRGCLKSLDVITAMLQGFENHLSQQTSTVLKLAYIVVYQDKVLPEFLLGLKQWKEKAPNDSSDSGSDSDKSTASEEEMDDTPFEVTIGTIKVKAMCGDITKETTDAIVNSTNTSLDLSSGVSGAILKAAGQSVVDECQACGKQPNDGVVITKAGNLQVKHIVHMVGQTKEKEITNSMNKVLKNCHSIGVQSVSFPALGTGLGNLAASQVASAMADAISTFVNEQLKPTITTIHIIIFQTKMLMDFEQVLKRFKNVTPKKSVLVKKQTTPLRSSSTSSPPQTTSNKRSLDLASTLAYVPYPVMTAEVYGVDTASLTEMKKCLEDLIAEECICQEVDAQHLCHLLDTEKQAIANLSQKHQVQIAALSSKLKVSGKKDDVLMALIQIKDFLQRAKDRKNQEREKERLCKTIRWERGRSNQWKALSSRISYELEMAYHRKEKTCVYKHKGETFTVDLTEMCQTDSKGKTCRVKRSLLSDSDTAVIQPPPTWTKMDGKDLVMDPLIPTSDEYKNVSKEFLHSCQKFTQTNQKKIEVVEIQKIQNREQWQRYAVGKQAMDKKYPKNKNEQILYHGTTKEICQKINKNGFNRSFGGRNATMYGIGTYFAKEAHYSCSDIYSSPDENGHKYIYRARVLTGMPCLGHKDLKEPTPLNPSDPTAGLHDCAVDRLRNPFIFVIFCDYGAYPEYLIKFKTI